MSATSLFDVNSCSLDLAFSLPELSPLALKFDLFLAEQLFSLWLSLPETGCLVKNLLVDGLSPRTVKQRSGLSSLGSPLKIVSEPVREVIPQVVSEDGKKVRRQHPLTESDMEELQDALDSGNCDEIRILMTFDCFGIFSFGYVAFTTDIYFEYYGEIFAGVVGHLVNLIKESKMASNFTAMSSVGSFVAHDGLVMNKKLSSSSNILSSLASIY
ncbi:hypothetical protein J1N35_007759 [Gossypium stocksii]|uniref:Uncharacterized protein n=1 Tax=Gossypium stocksii TaxID=47602 RepID=A0A9D3W729_9ROSI|nr:hypothetical protein J1N35_007759 [Gossypium stocksii]